jgi:uncharacterized protein
VRANRDCHLRGTAVIHPAVQESADGVSIRVKVQPRARHEKITGLLGDALKLSLTSPPVDGKANEACLRFFAQLFGVPGNAVSIIAGKTNRTKVLKIHGITRAIAESKLPPL